MSLLHLKTLITLSVSTGFSDVMIRAVQLTQITSCQTDKLFRFQASARDANSQKR